MNVLQNVKYVAITPPGAIVDNSAFTTTEIDTAGFRKATIVVQLGATDVAIAEFKLNESDTSGSGFTAVSGADFAAALPSATDDNNAYAIHVDLRGRKRYLDLSLTAGDGTTGTYASAFVLLADPEEGRDSAADRGYADELIV